MKWFRVYHEMVGDRKLRRLPPEQRWLWLAVLTIASESPIRGRLLLPHSAIPATPQDLEDLANIPPEEVARGLVNFEQSGMISIEDGVYVITNWAKRQYASDNVATRVSKHRTKQDCNVSETLSETLQEAPVKRFRNVLQITDNRDQITDNRDPEIRDPDLGPKQDLTHNDERTREDPPRAAVLFASPAPLEQKLLDSVTELPAKATRKNKARPEGDLLLFPAFWAIWPRKTGRAEAEEAWKKRVHSGVSPGALAQAARHYAAECLQVERELKFTLHAATFLNQRRYEDYLDNLPEVSGNGTGDHADDFGASNSRLSGAASSAGTGRYADLNRGSIRIDLDAPDGRK